MGQWRQLQRWIKKKRNDNKMREGSDSKFYFGLPHLNWRRRKGKKDEREVWVKHCVKLSKYTETKANMQSAVSYVPKALPVSHTSLPPLLWAFSPLKSKLSYLLSPSLAIYISFAHAYNPYIYIYVITETHLLLPIDHLLPIKILSPPQRSRKHFFGFCTFCRVSLSAQFLTEQPKVQNQNLAVAVKLTCEEAISPVCLSHFRGLFLWIMSL